MDQNSISYNPGENLTNGDFLNRKISKISKGVIVINKFIQMHDLFTGIARIYMRYNNIEKGN